MMRARLPSSLGTVLAVLLAAASFACVHTPPVPPIGEFSDQVLDPLASRLADERIAQEKTEKTLAFQQQEKAEAEKRPNAMLYRGLGLALDWMGAWSLGSLGAHAFLGFDQAQAEKEAMVRKVALDEQLAWLDTRRLPLQQELLGVLVQGVVPIAGGYAVCVEGKQRQYGFEDGRFLRLADGPGPCEVPELKSLKREAVT